MNKMLSLTYLLVLAFMSSPILSMKVNAKTRAMYDTNAINDAIHILEGSMQKDNDVVIQIDSGIIKPPPYFDAFQYTDMPCNETDGSVLRIFPEKCMQLVCKYRQVEPVYLYDKEMCNCCEHDGKLYKEGEELPGVCVKMFCCNGKWESTGHINECCGHCDVYGDPHIKPFDAPVTPVNWYHMHSHCNYSLAQKLEFGTQIGSMDPEFAVYAQFGDCASSKVSSCINTITVKDSEHAIVEIEMPDLHSLAVTSGASYIVRMNGWMNYIGMVPTPLYDMWGNRHPVQMWITESGCARLLGSQGFVLHICWHYVRIYAHASLMNDIGGLCGFYNEYDQDDHMTRNGDITPTSYFPQYPSPDFIFSWLTQDNNIDRCKQKPIRPMPTYPVYGAGGQTDTFAMREKQERLIPVMPEELTSYYNCMDQSHSPQAFSMCEGALMAWTEEPSQDDYTNLLEACIVDYCNIEYVDPAFSGTFPYLYSRWLTEMTMMKNMTIGPHEKVEPPCVINNVTSIVTVTSYYPSTTVVYSTLAGTTTITSYTTILVH